MFYEEKIIDGVLCYRTHPKARFSPYTAEQLTARYTEHILKIRELGERIEKLKDDVEFHAWEVPGSWQGKLDEANGRAERYKARWAECRRILMGLQAEIAAKAGLYESANPSNPVVRGGGEADVPLQHVVGGTNQED